MSKPRILVARAVFPEPSPTSNSTSRSSNQADTVWSKADLIARLKGKVGAFTTGTERIDGEVLAACPGLKICANMAVGFNNFDIPAMTAPGAGHQHARRADRDHRRFRLRAADGHRRRIAESEHYLRAGKWTKWSYDMFAGSDVHGSTLGILGMGRIGQGIAKRGAHGFGMNVIYYTTARA